MLPPHTPSPSHILCNLSVFTIAKKKLSPGSRKVAVIQGAKTNYALSWQGEHGLGFTQQPCYVYLVGAHAILQEVKHRRDKMVSMDSRVHPKLILDTKLYRFGLHWVSSAWEWQVSSLKCTLLVPHEAVWPLCKMSSFRSSMISFTFYFLCFSHVCWSDLRFYKSELVI